MGGQGMLGGGFKMMGGFRTILLGLVFLAADVVGSDNLTGENKQALRDNFYSQENTDGQEYFSNLLCFHFL